MDPVERMEIYRNVRAVLVRNFIDLGRLVVQIAPGTVQLRGTLQRLMGASPLSPEAIQAIILELKRLRGVRRVITDFDNWTVPENTHPHYERDSAAPPPAPEDAVHDLDAPPQTTPPA